MLPVIAKGLDLAGVVGWAFLAPLTALACLLFAEGRANSTPPKGISRTAFATMAYRAVGAQNPDPATRNPDDLAASLCNPDIIHDRLGLSLVFEKAIEEIERSQRYLFYYVTARTKYMDQVLIQAMDQGAGQVVVLAAGFDTRAHRFQAGHPGVRFFEVDRPPMVEIKQKMVLAKLSRPNPTLRYVPIDFETQQLDREMEKAGYHRQAKTLFIWEGSTMYLEARAVAATFSFVAGNCAPGSLVAFDHVVPPSREGADRGAGQDSAQAEKFRKLGEAIKWGIQPDKLQDFLAAQGLELVSSMGPDQIAQLYLTGSNGKPLGHMPRNLWFALARVPGD